MHKPNSRRPSLSAASASFAAVLLVLGCEGLPELKPPTLEGAGRSQAIAQPGPSMPQDPLATIARFEDARADGDGLLQMMLLRGEESTRVRAAVALGRMPYPELGREVTTALVTALDDAAPSVRAAAAFGLGLRADREAAAALLAHWKDEDTNVRARIVEAASRIDDARLRQEVLHSLQDPAVEVRAEAALAPHRWKATQTPPDAALVDSALADVLRPSAPTAKAAAPASEVETSESTAESPALLEPEPEVAYRALFSLARRKSERGRPLFLAAMSSRDARERIFAIQGLAALLPDPSSTRLLNRALTDQDWRVVYEATLAIAKQPTAEWLGALTKLLEHPSAHVRGAAYAALGRMETAKEEALKLLERAGVDASANVRAEGLEARATLVGDEMAPVLEMKAHDKDAVIRSGVAAAFAHLSPAISVPALVALTADIDKRVAGVAIEGLGKHPTPEARAHLRTLLASPDNGLRLGALLALRESQAPEDLPFLDTCYASSTGEIAPEIAYSALESAAKLDAALVRDLLKRGCAHTSAYVRKRARELFAEKFPKDELPRTTAPSTHPASVPIAGRDSPEHRRNPRVEIKTNRGSMIFELFADEAPLHVRSFLELARADRYDGTLFHRVVPDFVIQGGDPRGDGNGGSSWRGDALRAEFTPRKFVRGSLGMPRNDDPDSGGSQLFVTHRETPHLDGRYTLFGELKEGFDVLDAIEVGDVIQDVRVLGADGMR